MTKEIPGLGYNLLSEGEKIQVENLALYKMQDDYTYLMEKFCRLNASRAIGSEYPTNVRQTKGLRTGSNHDDIQVLICPNSLYFRKSTSLWDFESLVRTYGIGVGLDIIGKLREIVG